MPRRARHYHATALPALAALAVLMLAGCSSTGDFGRLRDDLVTDDIHDWVGRDAAAGAGVPISHDNLTDDERTLRDLAFPLIEPPYDRQRWDAVLYEYGIDHYFKRQMWTIDTVAYSAHLQGTFHRSSTGRYDQLIDDMRNDIVRIDPFFQVAHQVLDLDRRRQATMQYVADLTETERANALARIGENSLTIAWVFHSLTARCASYRYALEHLTVAEPEPVAADADRILTELQQRIAANQIVPVPHLAALPLRLAAN
jgi:hypothetical protein